MAGRKFKPKPPHGRGVKPIADKVGVALTVANYYFTPHAATTGDWVRGFASEGLSPQEIATVLSLPVDEIEKYFPREKRKK